MFGEESLSYVPMLLIEDPPLIGSYGEPIVQKRSGVCRGVRATARKDHTTHNNRIVYRIYLVWLINAYGHTSSG